MGLSDINYAEIFLSKILRDKKEGYNCEHFTGEAKARIERDQGKVVGTVRDMTSMWGINRCADRCFGLEDAGRQISVTATAGGIMKLRLLQGNCVSKNPFCERFQLLLKGP